MAANNDMNGDGFGRYGDEFVDLDEEFDEQGGGINPEGDMAMTSVASGLVAEVVRSKMFREPGLLCEWVCRDKLRCSREMTVDE